MEPKILSKEALAIAGVSGSGNKTGEVWKKFMELNRTNPLKNKEGKEEYEIRMYPGEGPGEVHIGMSVKNASVPAEYKIFFLPASLYAEFEIYPSKGWESSNAEMDKWLSNNAAVYTQSRMGNMKYVVEVYDDRFKGENDPDSVVNMLIPLTKTDIYDMGKIIAEQTEELAKQIEKFAGAEVRAKVMTGSDAAAATFDPVKRAPWYKEVIDRLDAINDDEIRRQILTACGQHCQSVFSKEMEDARDRRRFFITEEEFLAYELQPPPGTGVRFEREGNIIYNYYTPRQYGEGMRCYCYLIGGLPGDVTASPTYCQCSRAWIQKYWEGALGRPVRVELGETAISSRVDECKFIIHL